MCANPLAGGAVAAFATDAVGLEIRRTLGRPGVDVLRPRVAAEATLILVRRLLAAEVSLHLERLAVEQNLIRLRMRIARHPEGVFAEGLPVQHRCVVAGGGGTGTGAEILRLRQRTGFSRANGNVTINNGSQAHARTRSLLGRFKHAFGIEFFQGFF